MEVTRELCDNAGVTVVMDACVLNGVTQRPSLGGALRDDTKNGCVGDYVGPPATISFNAPFNNMRNLKYKSPPTVAFSRPSINVAVVYESE